MTKYIKEKEIDDNTMFEISNDMKNGKIVVFKTDTVYGIGTNAFNEESCKKIYKIKGRPLEKPLCVLISDISMLKKIVDFISPTEQKLIDAFWPGPLTIIFKIKEKIFPNIVSAGNELVGFRLLKNGFAHSLIKVAGVPIVAPSANLSGSPTGTNMKNIISELDGKVDYILDSGNIKDDTTSTIIEVNNEKVIIIREGKITKNEIAQVLSLKNNIYTLAKNKGEF